MIGRLNDNPLPRGDGLERTADFEEIEPYRDAEGRLYQQYRATGRQHWWVDGREVNEAEYAAARIAFIASEGSRP
jgi:hypothetical protein